MPAHVIDSHLFRDMYGTEPLRAVFADANLVQCWLDYEAALARAEAAEGLIPTEAAEEITARARVENIDFAALKEGIDETVHELVPLIRQLASRCEGDAGRYVHWGATTQDVTDTGLVLQLRQAHGHILHDLQALSGELAALARRERDTVMPGRTHGQHALPITFGFKVAIWLDEVRRHIERMHQVEPRLLVGQFAGAVGSLASLSERGPAVQARLMAELGLAMPAIGWHPARDRFAEYGVLLALVAATMGKIAHEIILLQKSEVAEVEEPYRRGKVGSSTMPHKRNPMLCEGILAEARLARGLVPTLLGAMEAEHERDWSAMHVEWAALPEICILAGGAVAHTLQAIRGLRVDRKRMRRNVDLLHGLMMSEAVMLRLGEFVGRQTAHEIVHEASMRAFEEERPLRDTLLEDEHVTRHLSAQEITDLLRPEAYIGLCTYFVDQVLANSTEE
ncbi:MAG: adenylosuccinate lyase [Caldilineae bacterium]|nr:MAG: adenylosuccinate lyase [Caldilineae bacterium]